MHIAVSLPQIGRDVGAVLDAARAAEDAGAWGVWVFDNLAPLRRPDLPSLEGWSLLGPVARATSRIKLISLVTRAGMRPPGLVARMAAVVQASSDGRLVVGLGAGDRASRREERRFGVDAPASRAVRLALLEETARRLRGDDEPVIPAIVPPHIWVAGAAPDLVAAAGRIADAWHGWDIDLERFGAIASALRIPAWWGAMFDPATARRTLDALANAGAAGVTWMIASQREREYRPLLHDVVRRNADA
jgi:alkanesulfonate monooxygenase SsuD/methylene tetrahydromethanopterin reductase-like flavin-dependent oxidoreductase (luciferase family)